MEYKKTIILLALVVFLLSIAGVSASEIDNTIASENANTIELSIDNDIEDNLQTSEENEALASTDYDEAIAQTDTEVLGADSAKYSDLANEINQPGNITLTNKSYTYDKDATAITISEDNKVIDGNGAVIDMNGSTIRAFTVTASGVTIKNLTIKNAKYSGLPGGAIYFGSTGTVSNCNFTDNDAYYGGAVFFYYEGTVTNCNFVNNSASTHGGAVYFDLTGTVSNCNFTNNTAKMGNAIYIYNKCTISDCDFTNNPITKGAIHSVTGDITLSNNIINVDDVVSDKNFTEIQKLIDRANDGDEITINGLYAGFGIPIRITKSLTLNGQNNTTLDAKKLSKILYITANNVIIKNIQFTSGYAENGGAIYFSSTGTVTNCNFTDNDAYYGGAVYFSSVDNVTNCNFVNNSASTHGGAVYFYGEGTVSNCNFTNNTASGDGGAINMGSGTVTNCNFVDNKAATGDYGRGGAVYLDSNGEVTDCNFTKNSAALEGGAVFLDSNGEVTNCNFADNSAIRGGAIYSFQWSTTADTCIFKTSSDSTNVNTVIYPPTLNVNNFTTVYGSGDKLTFDLKTNSSIPVTNGNISISVYFKGNGEWVRNYTCLSGEGWIPDLPVGSYIAFFDTEYAKFQKINRTITITAPEHTFWFLNYTINGNDNPVIELSHDFYFDPAYDAAFVNGIVINRPVTIKGNGNAIDANRQARIFYVQSANAVLENLTIKNANYNGNGGAIYFSPATSGTVSNCNFINNKATGTDSWGGAIRMYSGTVSNCNFVNNSATGEGSWGGAIMFVNTGTVSNCNFADNTAYRGGAVYFLRTGNVTNCNFTDNTASGDGGAVYFLNTGNVTNCNFTDNTASEEGGAVWMYSGTVSNCNFTGNNASRDGGAIRFSDEGNVTNCNFTGNTANEDGGAVYFYRTGTVSNCNFTSNNATWGSAIYFYKYDSSGKLTISNSTFLNNRASVDYNAALNVTINENNITITFVGQNNLLNAIYSRNDAKVTFTNVTYWGAKGITTISATMSGSNKAAGQNITVGVVVNGKVVLNEVNVTNENGTIVLDISAGENYYISARHVTDSYYTEAEKTISNNINVNVTSQTTTNKTVNITAKSNIPNDVVQGKLLFILPNGTQINATYGTNGTWWAVHEFDKYDVYQVNATYVGLDNVTINNGTITINKVNSTISLDNIVLDYGESENVTVTTIGATGITAKIGESEANVTGFIISIPVLDAGTYTLTVTTIPDDDYNPVTKEVNITVNKVNSTLTVGDMVFDYGSSGSIIVSVTGADGVNATVVGQPKAVVKVNGTNITVSDLDAGTYTLTVTAIGDKNHNNVTKNATITVNKLKTELTGNAITTTYNVNKDLVITLKDSTGKALSGVKVTVDLNGAKTYTTDKNGQVKVSTKGIAPKAYTAKVTFNGDTNYDKSTKDIKVTVKKATPKLTAKKKTYKTTPKTKKYTIVLKDNTGKAIKKAKVTLKVKGKTYKATTNSKGKATFKITKLNKKGTFKATITYKGNKYYNKVSKKAKIKVIVTFKTVSKGSKDKATVKEIQQALKDKGYYLTYQGHYLKVDGKFNSCTFRSIKEFQKDKGLKVTGKVDEKTAKKLGII